MCLGKKEEMDKYLKQLELSKKRQMILDFEARKDSKDRKAQIELEIVKQEQKRIRALQKARKND